MSNPTKPASSDHWLRRESLELKKLINLARGAPVPNWPPDQEWTEIFQDLKDAIDRSELPAALRGPSAWRRSSVRLLDLWSFVKDRDARWQPLRDFCQRWAKASGISLSRRRNQWERQEARTQRDGEIQGAAEKLWTRAWESDNRELLNKEAVAQQMLQVEEYQHLVQDLRVVQGERKLLSQESIVRLISEPDWVKEKSKARRKAIQPRKRATN